MRLPKLLDLRRMAEATVAMTARALPIELRKHAESLPVSFESIPNPDTIADGVDPDTLGLFVGPEYGEEATALAGVPAQIILYLENLWDYCEGDEDLFRGEVRTTFLHELGHYLGLDEEDLERRGLL